MTSAGPGSAAQTDRAVRLVLASASPERQRLLSDAGYAFSVVPSQLVEPAPDSFPSAEAYVTHMAWLKATAVASSGDAGSLPPATMILGADTVAVVGGRVLGKPRDRDDAQRILCLLGGTCHAVVTGLCLHLVGSDVSLLAHERTTLEMAPWTQDHLEQYLDSGLWAGKAGAYGLQEPTDPFVRIIEGSRSNVLGLPMDRLARLLRMADRLDTARGGTGGTP